MRPALTRILRWALYGAAAFVLSAAVRPPALAAPPSESARPRQAVARGLDYLRRVQEADGSWSHYPGTTALAVSAFLRNSRSEAHDPAVSRGVQYLLSCAKPNGAIYSAGNPATALPNYNTALSVMAIALTRNPAYRGIIRRAQEYLEHSQFDEESGVNPSSPNYGGIGYGSRPDRADLSNLQLALEGLKESGAPADAPVWQRAIVFLQRVQNRKESNDQAWARDSTDDGGFVYQPNGRTVASVGGHESTGAMSYAGLKSYIYCGVSRSDARAQAAWRWIGAHYTVAEHPGMGETSLYYYYHTMAKTLDVYGQKLVRDSGGRRHDWAHDLSDELVRRQHPDGSWYNDNARYWEDQPALVTSYSLIALAYCLKRA